MYYCYLDTPIGELLLAGDEEALCLVGFPEGSMRREPDPDWIFAEKPLAEFQLRVLDELQKIPYGTTTSYGEIAKRIGRPKAVRAVGAANGRNPIPIVIPCHRVIGSTGSMTGFGGGIPTKEALLRLEMEHSQFPHTA